MSSTRDITLRPALLAYQNTVVISGVTLTLDVEYRVRDDDWWLSILDAQGEPIAQGIRVVVGRPLPAGVFDERLPQGGRFIAVRLEDGDYSHPRAGELGAEVRLLWQDSADVRADIEEAGLGVNYLQVRSIKSIGAVP